MSLLENNILEYLGSRSDPTSPLDIAKAVIGPDARKKDVNPTLYKLLKENRVTKSSTETGAKPRWALVR